MTVQSKTYADGDFLAFYPLFNGGTIQPAYDQNTVHLTLRGIYCAAYTVQEPETAEGDWFQVIPVIGLSEEDTCSDASQASEAQAPLGASGTFLEICPGSLFLRLKIRCSRSMNLTGSLSVFQVADILS